MYIMEEGQWAAWFWVPCLKKDIKNFESGLKDGQDVLGFEHQARMGWLSLVRGGELQPPVMV